MKIRTGDKIRIDQGSDAVSRQVVEMVADELTVDPVKLPPLYEAIDPDILDAHFAPATSHHCPRFGQVTFTYVGYEITVAYDGKLVITLDEYNPAVLNHSDRGVSNAP